MENTKTIFCSSDISDVQTELEAFCNNRNEIYISIIDTSENSGYNQQFVCLTKETAVKFVKHLKREIAFLIQSEKEAFNG